MLRRVTKEEYEAYLEANRDHLYCDVCGISEPPSINHYEGGLVGGKIDFPKDEEGYPILRAHTFAYSDKPGDYDYEPEEERYYSIDDGQRKAKTASSGAK